MIIYDQQDRLLEFLGYTGAAAIGHERNGVLVGAVAYTGWTGPNIDIHAVGKGYWLTHEFLQAIFAYPFLQLGCTRVTAPVASGNNASIRLCLHVGFEREARLKGYLPNEDLIYLVMWRDKCRWLKEKQDGSAKQVSPSHPELIIRDDRQ